MSLSIMNMAQIRLFIIHLLIMTESSFSLKLLPTGSSIAMEERHSLVEPNCYNIYPNIHKSNHKNNAINLESLDNGVADNFLRPNRKMRVSENEEVVSTPEAVSEVGAENSEMGDQPYPQNEAEIRQNIDRQFIPNHQQEYQKTLRQQKFSDLNQQTNNFLTLQKQQKRRQEFHQVQPVPPYLHQKLKKQLLYQQQQQKKEEELQKLKQQEEQLPIQHIQKLQQQKDRPHILMYGKRQQWQGQRIPYMQKREGQNVLEYQLQPRQQKSMKMKSDNEQLQIEAKERWQTKDRPHPTFSAVDADSVNIFDLEAIHKRAGRYYRPFFVRDGCAHAEDGFERFSCPSDRDICIDDHQLCNGSIDCPDNEDESPTMCLLHDWVKNHFKTIESHLDKLSKRLRL